jgi:hypothetical protein
MVVGLRQRVCQIRPLWARGSLPRRAVALAGGALLVLAAAAPAGARPPRPAVGNAPTAASSAAASLPPPADPAAPSPDGGAPPAEETVEVPVGRDMAPARGRPDPAELPVVACSFREPVCVHAATTTPGASVLATLGGAERAMKVFDALGFPRPLPDGQLGGSPAYDIYLVAGAEPATTIDLDSSIGDHDSASAFTVLPPLPWAGCDADLAAARSVAQAMVMRLDAGAEAGAVVMGSSYLADLAAGPCPAEIALVDDFQREPERALTAYDIDDASGSMLFPWYLDDVYAAGAPGSIILGFLTIATQKTPPGSFTWHNEPDLFDALRATMKNRGSSIDQLLLDFAVARAFVGSRSDGLHPLGDTARFGDAGRVRFEWSVPFSSLPRRLAPGTPIDPTGATYLWLDLASAPPGAELTFAADWELPSLFRWCLLKIDKKGGEAGRVEVAGVYGSSHAERSVVGLDGLAGVLVVGMNAGSMVRSHPFDPDEPYLAHAYTVTLAR